MAMENRGYYAGDGSGGSGGGAVRAWSRPFRIGIGTNGLEQQGLGSLSVFDNPALRVFFPSSGNELEGPTQLERIQRVRLVQDTPGFAAVIGEPVADSRSMRAVDGYGVLFPVGGLATGIANGMFCGFGALAQINAAGPVFSDLRTYNSNAFLGVSTTADGGAGPTPDNDLDLIVTSDSGVVTRTRLVGARTDDLLLVEWYATPGGARLVGRVYNAETAAEVGDELVVLGANVPQAYAAPFALGNKAGAAGNVSYEIGAIVGGMGPV